MAPVILLLVYLPVVSSHEILYRAETLHTERTTLGKIVYLTTDRKTDRQRFTPAIIDAETLQSLFVNISRIFRRY